MKRLIVTADDLGLHRGMTEGAIEAHRHGIVTACSVVANGIEVDHAIEQLRSNPSLDVGAHLCFVEERPLLPLSRVRSLVGRTGHFHRGFRSFFLRERLRLIRYEELADEMRAQIERLLRTDLKLVHLNAHQHLHLLPRVFEVVERLADEYAIRWVRVVSERPYGHAARKLSIAALNRYAAKAARGSKSTHSARTIGVSEAGHLNETKLLRLLSEVESTTELVVHPGRGNDAMARAYDWGYDWDSETDALCSPVVRARLEELGIALASIHQ